MTHRNPRRAYDAEGREIAPPTIGSLRAHGDTTAAVHCHARGCHHSAVICTDRFPADLPFPDIALRIRCSACGSRNVGVMLDMQAHYARCRLGAGPMTKLPSHYQVIGRDVPWPDQAPRDGEAGHGRSAEPAKSVRSRTQRLSAGHRRDS